MSYRECPQYRGFPGSPNEQCAAGWYLGCCPEARREVPEEDEPEDEK